MQIVIDIPEEYYKSLLENCRFSSEEIPVVSLAIATGTPLPEGHGRLIDADALCITTVHGFDEEDELYRYVSDFNLDHAPTIIEADEAESEEQT